MAFTSGIQSTYTYNGVIITPIYGVAITQYANRAPLTALLDLQYNGADSFKISTDRFRPSSNQLNEDLDNSETGIDVDDGSMFLAGDVIEVDSEAMLVTSISTNTLTVTRGYAGTSAASHTDNTAVYLIGNSRTGAEVDVDGISFTPTTNNQYLQTFQQPWQVGGSLATNTAVVIPSGAANWARREEMDASQRCMDDIERAYYYGRGVARAATTTRPAMYGLRSLLTTNNTTSPTNASAYKPSDLIRDTVQKCYDGGGNPNVLLVSTDFMTGFSEWGHAAMRIEAGASRFGVSINMFDVPFLPGLTVVPAPLLRAGTAICLSEAEVSQQVKRALYNKPRGSRGDAEEGDILAEVAIKVDNESHHAYVSGISAFSAS
jgi:hypothetical protein